MLLNTLITTVNEKLDITEETLLEIIELIGGEEDFTEEYLLSDGISKTHIDGLLDILNGYNLIETKYSYECGINEGEVEVVNSLNEKCVFCNNPIEGCEFHIARKLYSANDVLLDEVHKREKKELKVILDNEYLANFEKLKSELDKIVPFLGSGISIPLGLPNWTGLISKMESGLTDPSDIEQFREYLDGGDIFNAIDILQKESLTYRSEEQIKSFIKDCINDNLKTMLDQKYHNINDILNLKSSFYITTNYDNALSYYKVDFSSPYILDDIKVMQDLYSEQNQRIIHLHGNVDRKESMVVTEKDYKKLYENEKNKSILSGIMAPKSFSIYWLFIY